MLIFWRLLLGHLLADFTFQFNAINAWKRRNIWGMLVHCAMHPFFYILLTWKNLGEIWVSVLGIQLSGWACVALITLLHFTEDQSRVGHIRKHRSRDNTIYFLVDQLIH